MSLVILSGLDEAIVGLGQRLVGITHRAFLIYDASLILELLVERDGMEIGDAIRHFQENIQGFSIGENTPAFMQPMDADGLRENVDQIVDILACESE